MSKITKKVVVPRRILIKDGYYISGKHWKKAELAKQIANKYKYWKILIQEDIEKCAGKNYRSFKRKMKKVVETGHILEIGMTKKTKKASKIDSRLKEFAIDKFRQYAWHIGVSHYHADILWVDEDKRLQGDDILAEIIVDRRYLKAIISIYPVLVRKWKRGEKEEVAHALAHEISHIATQHLFDCATSTYVEEEEMKDAWETLTEMIGRMAVKIDDLAKTGAVK